MRNALALALALSALLMVDGLLALAAALVWKRFRHTFTSADGILALRLLPFAIAFVAVFSVVLPTFLIHEPLGTSERIGLPLVVLAWLSAFEFLRSAKTTWYELSLTRKLSKTWQPGARQIRLAGINVPVYRFAHAFPVVAVIGIRRPSLFIADQVLAELDDTEIRAVIAHEAAHVSKRDNLRRTLMKICAGGWNWLPAGRDVTRAWSRAAEHDADAHAARAEEGAALALASALIKIARMMPAGARPTLPVAALLTGDATSALEQRIQRLAAFGEADALGEDGANSRWHRIGAMGSLLVPIALFWSMGLTSSVQTLIEYFVAVLT